MRIPEDDQSNCPRSKTELPLSLIRCKEPTETEFLADQVHNSCYAMTWFLHLCMWMCNPLGLCSC